MTVDAGTGGSSFPEPLRRGNRGPGLAVITAGGLRVHIARPRRGVAHRGDLLTLHNRDPERRPPPDLEAALPTPLEPEAQREPIVIDPVPQGVQHRALWTLWQVVRFLVRRTRLRMTGQLDDTLDATMTRQLFERLSGMWIKVGQLLSLRSDLLSAPMCRELANLQYQMRGFPSEVARQVIEEELRRPISTVFASFDVEPFAAASIAQVHRATLLRNNRAVVVKVMRPDVARSFARDFRLIGSIIRLLRLFGRFRRLRLDDGMRELRTILEEEVDYQHEAVNLRRMRRNLRRHGVYVPRVVRSLSGHHILVIEEVRGVLMSDYIRLRRDDPDRVYRWSVLNGIDGEKVAQRLSITVLRQILEDNEFHGDVHPGNIMLLTDNRIGLIDFGSVGRLQERTWRLYRHSLAALAQRDYERAADYMLMLSPPAAPRSHRRMRRALAATLVEWEFKAQFARATYADRSIATMSQAVWRVMAEHNVPVGWGIMRVGRTFSTLDASLQTLAPDADFMKMARAYFRDRTRRRSTRRGRMEVLQTVVQRVSAMAGDMELLIGSGAREYALRFSGMLDRAGYVRLTALTYLSRLVWLIIALTGFAAFVDEDLRRVVAPEGTPVHEFLDWLAAAVPHLHPLHWVALLVIGLTLARLVHATRNSLARMD